MAAVRENPALRVRALAREAVLGAGGRGFVRYLPPGGALLATDALARCADAAQEKCLTDALTAAGFDCVPQGALLGLTPADALLLRAAGGDVPPVWIDWDGPLAPAQALAARWLQKPRLPLTNAGRALAMETLRLLWQPRVRVLTGLGGLRALAAANLRAGDASGAHEAGCYLSAWLELAAQNEEERI